MVIKEGLLYIKVGSLHILLGLISCDYEYGILNINVRPLYINDGVVYINIEPFHINFITLALHFIITEENL